MKFVKRRAAGGRLLHFLEGFEGTHMRVALCGQNSSSPRVGGSGRGWRYPGEDRDNMAPNTADCPRCVAAFIKAGGQFS
jgi:hypothetical protein